MKNLAKGNKLSFPSFRSDIENGNEVKALDEETGKEYIFSP